MLQIAEKKGALGFGQSTDMSALLQKLNYLHPLIIGDHIILKK